MSQANDALESDAGLGQRRKAFERIQDEFEGVEGRSPLEEECARLKADRRALVEKAVRAGYEHGARDGHDQEDRSDDLPKIADRVLAEHEKERTP